MARRAVVPVVSASLALVVPVMGWLIGQHLQPPGYDPYRQTISALAAHGATDRWVMTAGLFVLGLAHVATAALLPQIGRPARVLLAVGGVATVAVAALPQPNPWHLVAAGFAFAAFTVWPSAARVPGRRARFCATGLLAALLLWFGLQLGGGALLGFSERILVAAEALWPLVVATIIGMTDRDTVKALDVLYFLAEIAVYVAVEWWSFTRAVPTPARWGLGIGLLVVFAGSWGLVASPRARTPLRGWLDPAFRVLWFGLGIAAAVVVISR